MITKPKTVPELRFPGFGEDWQVCTIAELGKVVTGGTPDTSDSSLYGGDFMFVSPSDIGDARYVIATTKTLTEAGHKTGRRIPKGSIVFVCIGSTIGKVAQVGAECTTNQQINTVVPDRNHDANFLMCVLDKEAAQIRLLAGKQAVPIINKSTFAAISITIPTLPEQRKIAEFLTAVDGRIGQLSQKKALLEDYKKGVMQQLFTQALRFKDDHGNDFPEWEEKNFTDVLGTTSPRGFQIQSSEILQEGRFKVVDQGKALIAGYCDDSEKVMRTCPVIVYGDHTTIIKYVDFEFVVGADGTQILVSKDQRNDLKYLYYNLAQNNVTQEGYKRHFSILKGILMQIPSPAEQTKIANFLTALDRKIESVAQQIRHTQAFKKGLLQQMFV